MDYFYHCIVIFYSFFYWKWLICDQEPSHNKIILDFSMWKTLWEEFFDPCCPLSKSRYASSSVRLLMMVIRIWLIRVSKRVFFYFKGKVKMISLILLLINKIYFPFSVLGWLRDSFFPKKKLWISESKQSYFELDINSQKILMTNLIFFNLFRETKEDWQWNKFDGWKLLT